MADLSFTHIYESARKDFDLSRDEYALCNYIQTWAGYPGDVPGWCNRTQNEMALFIGITSRGLRKMLLRLESFDLIQRNPKNGMCRSTKKWFDRVVLAKEEEEQSSATRGTKFRNERNKVPILLKEIKEDKKREDKDMSGTPDAVPDKHITDALKEQLDALIEEHKTATPERREEIVKLGKKTKQRYELELKIDQTILHLNKKTGFRYKLPTVEARKIIEKRLAKNTIEEIFQVIDYKSDEWKDNIKMRGNLVPATLLNGHFEDYYQASLLKPKKKNENEAVYTPPVKRFAQ